MFSFLFGKRSDKGTTDKNTQIAGAIANPTSDLHAREEHLEKKIKQLEKIKQSHHQNAVEQKAKGNTNSALHFLKKEKLIDDELATANGMLLTIIQQRSALEQSLMNTESLQVLNKANQSIKQSQSIWSADKVSDLVDEMEDTRSVAREINDLISGSNRLSISDDELLASLESDHENNLVAQVSHVSQIPKMPELPKASVIPAGFAMDLPVTPVTVIQSNQNKNIPTQSMLQELEAL
jgi:phage shock protein A